MKRACNYFTSKVVIMFECEFHMTFEKAIIIV